MDIQTLKYFLSLAELKNFTDASEECSITQSALSKSIKKLESELGEIQLFNRKKQPVTLTDAGIEFNKYARKMIEDYFNMLNSMMVYQPNSNRKVILGTIPAVWNFGLLNYISDLKSMSHDILELELVDATSKELVNKLENKEIDAAFIIVDKKARYHGLTYFDILDNTLSLCVSKKHSFSSLDTISLREASNETFISLDQSTTTYDIMKSQCISSGFNPKRIITCKNIETVFNLTAANDGVSLVSNKLAKIINNKNTTLLKLQEKPSYTITLAVRPDYHRYPAVKHLVDFTIVWKYH